MGLTQLADYEPMKYFERLAFLLKKRNLALKK